MRALMLDPPLILLDEPLGALDPVTRYELQDQLKSIFSELNKTVIMVTHDMSEAAYLGGEASMILCAGLPNPMSKVLSARSAYPRYLRPHDQMAAPVDPARVVRRSNRKRGFQALHRVLHSRGNPYANGKTGR